MLNNRVLDKLRNHVPESSIRRGTLGDYTNVLRLYLMELQEEEHLVLAPDNVAAASAAILSVLTNETRTAVLSECDGQLAGQVFYDILPERVESGFYVFIHSLYVHPDFRNRRIGEELIVTVINNSKTIGATRLTIFDGSEGCPKLYETLGGKVSRIEYEVRL